MVAMVHCPTEGVANTELMTGCTLLNPFKQDKRTLRKRHWPLYDPFAWIAFIGTNCYGEKRHSRGRLTSISRYLSNLIPSRMVAVLSVTHLVPYVLLLFHAHKSRLTQDTHRCIAIICGTRH